MRFLFAVAMICFLLMGWKCSSEEPESDKAATTQEKADTAKGSSAKKAPPPGDDGDGVWLDEEVPTDGETDETRSEDGGDESSSPPVDDN